MGKQKFEIITRENTNWKQKPCYWNKNWKTQIENKNNIYLNELNGIGDIQIPQEPQYEYSSSYYFFWIQTNHRDELAKFLLDKGIYTTFRYWPLHKVKFFSKYKTCEYPNSDFAASNTLNIPLHQSMTDENIDLIIKSIKLFYEQK